MFCSASSIAPRTINCQSGRGDERAKRDLGMQLSSLCSVGDLSHVPRLKMRCVAVPARRRSHLQRVPDDCAAAVLLLASGGWMVRGPWRPIVVARVRCAPLKRSLRSPIQPGDTRDTLSHRGPTKVRRWRSLIHCEPRAAVPREGCGHWRPGK